MPVRTLVDLAKTEPDWFWETDASQNFSYLSPEAERVLGRNAETLTGTSRLWASSAGSVAWLLLMGACVYAVFAVVWSARKY